MHLFNNDIETCITVLKEGGLILYPTDTIWGIGCDATNGEAIKKIYQLKKRSDEKAMIILLNEKLLSAYFKNISGKPVSVLKNTKKPTTVILPDVKGLPEALTGKESTLGCRIPDDEFCRELIDRFDKPIVSTSANISGEASPKNYSEISAEIKNGVGYIVQHRQKDMSSGSPSRIIKLSANGEMQIIRD
ncbi:L-threonylcarbamoyladenylate synthase [soil metagenome]